MATASDVLRIAAGQVGYSRWDDPRQGTKYGRWYADLTGDDYYSQNGVPYCCMFVSWVLSQAKQACVGFPSAYCPTSLAAATRAGLAVGIHDARAGDIVFFDWDGGMTDHVGFVEINKGSYLQTIEGNTSSGASGSQGNGGVVARRTRDFSTVCGVIRPRYNGGSGRPDTGGDVLDVDGWVGFHTVKRWQQIMGTPVDGIITGQDELNRRYLSRVYAIQYDEGGSALVRAVQRATGATVDGYIGPLTVKAIQRRLGVTQDGYFGEQTAKALQRRLNKGRF